ncbi:hypothetical protein WR25_03648 [Diploscapter pachys]|uniref:Uncharacterized protein n=1 Tax=Diploscapter pachys TaxID=2018661 RepID=A0A2A2KN41_9BILA|nr:hypothetical protein WR25_03648 [Diploscapter pachys]
MIKGGCKELANILRSKIPEKDVGKIKKTYLDLLDRSKSDDEKLESLRDTMKAVNSGTPFIDADAKTFIKMIRDFYQFYDTEIAPNSSPRVKKFHLALGVFIKNSLDHIFKSDSELQQATEAIFDGLLPEDEREGILIKGKVMKWFYEWKRKAGGLKLPAIDMKQYEMTVDKMDKAAQEAGRNWNLMIDFNKDDDY